MRFSLFFSSALLATLAAALPAPERYPGTHDKKEYNIVLKKDLSFLTQPQVVDIKRLLGLYCKKQRAGSMEMYTGALSQDDIAKLEDSGAIEIIELNHEVFPTAKVTQRNAPWGLAALSRGSSSSKSAYTYESVPCGAKYAYVLDTGVLLSHKDFEGRAKWGSNTIDEVDTDEHGHGTHVAGIIGGRVHGVFKDAEIISVKVLGGTVEDPKGTMNSVIAGLNWAADDIIEKGREKDSVINMSLGGERSRILNNVIDEVVSRGITVVVAAGNDDKSAYEKSPASARSAITVGAHDKNFTRATFSNYGTLLDVFAPGVGITSAYIWDDSSRAVLSGTSMASPHVAGLVLYYKCLDSSLVTPRQVLKRVKDCAQADVEMKKKGDPNEVAYNCL